MSLITGFAVALGGLAGLWFAGDFVVHYAVQLGARFKLSQFLLGFIILAIAAGIPELAIAITSALQGASGVSAGDIIGANFSDVTLVVGTTLLLSGGKGTISAKDRRGMLAMIFLSALVMFLVFAAGHVTRTVGIGLIATYIASILWLWKSGTKDDILHEEVAEITEHETHTKDWFLTSTPGIAFKLLASLAVVMVISHFTVDAALDIALLLNFAPERVGAVILGIGSSLPELALSMGALRRGQLALALGPTLGTVLEQTTFIFGILATLSHAPVQLAGLWTDAVFMFISFGLISFGLLSRRFMGRPLGIALLVLFGAYLAFQSPAVQMWSCEILKLFC